VEKGVNAMKTKAVVCCMGYCFQVYQELLARKYELIGFADNDSAKWGKTLSVCEGDTCTSVEAAIAKNPEVMIVATRNWNIVNSVMSQVRALAPELKVIGLKEAIGSSYSFADSEYQNCYRDECGNECYFEENLVLGRMDFSFEGCNNTVRIGKGVRIDSNLHCMVFGDGNDFEIGDGTTISSLHVRLAEHGSITIGKDCMLAGDIEIFQAAFHPIFDAATGKRENPSKPVRIGDHVWIGEHAGLMSGFEIADGSVIGYGAVSSGHFGSGVVIAGSPARVIREGIEWERDTVGIYEMNSVSESLERRSRVV
jgi:acetyltransferase-like isoleucine patch superfamily enzyme